MKGSRARVIEAGQKERQRLERNLHDGAQQRLIALSLELSLLEKQLADDPEAATRLDRGAAARSPSRSTSFATVARGLHPAVLSGHGLEVALQSIAARSPTPVRLQVDSTARLPEQIEVAAYYVVSESLANIGKHAQATCVDIDVSRADGVVVVEVVDDGVGGADTEQRLRPARPRRSRRGARRPAAHLEPRGRRHAASRGDPVRVVIAEDSVLLREGSCACSPRPASRSSLSATTPTICCSRCAATRRTSRSSTSGCRRRTTTRGCARRSRSARSHPSVGVLVLSQYVELGLAMKLLADSAEGVGYLLKDRISDVDEFVAAVRRVAEGGSALDPIIVSTLLSRQRPGDPLARLTAREREVLELMAAGSSNQGIADKLVITLRAVEKYVSSIFGKLGLPSTGTESRRVLAVLMFLRS